MAAYLTSQTGFDERSFLIRIVEGAEAARRKTLLRRPPPGRRAGPEG
jgi:hypothetical protein